MIEFIDFLAHQFTYYRKNKEVAKVGLLDFEKDIRNKIINSGEIVISPHNKNHNIGWFVKKNESGRLKIICQILKYRIIGFHDFIIGYLRKYQVVVILFKNKTGELLNPDNEIIELWGYRMIMFDEVILLEPVSHEELFESAPTNPSIIYCGPEGKILGWEQI